jgi:hypothetical protein
MTAFYHQFKRTNVLIHYIRTNRSRILFSKFHLFLRMNEIVYLKTSHLLILLNQSTYWESHQRQRKNEINFSLLSTKYVYSARMKSSLLFDGHWIRPMIVVYPEIIALRQVTGVSFVNICNEVWICTIVLASSSMQHEAKNHKKFSLSLNIKSLQQYILKQKYFFINHAFF